jgi:hypothetical protein
MQMIADAAISAEEQALIPDRNKDGKTRAMPRAGPASESDRTAVFGHDSQAHPET